MPELVKAQEALAGVRRHLASRPGVRALESIIEQLEYFIAYSRGENDGALLGRMNMGVLAMREIDQVGDLDLAMMIYRIESEAHRIAGGASDA